MKITEIVSKQEFNIALCHNVLREIINDKHWKGCY